MRKHKSGDYLHFLIVAILGIIMIIPFYFIIINSFKSYSEIMLSFYSFPLKLRIENYTGIMTLMNVGTALRNSALVTLASVVLTIFISSPTGHTLQRMGTKFSKAVYFYLIAGLAIPFHAIMVPLLQTVKDINGLNNLVVLSVIYTAFNIPFCTFLYYGFANSVPLEVEESAIIDGCGPIRMFYSIIFPLLKPATFTAAVLFFMWNWNEFMISYLLVVDQGKRTLMPELMTCIGNNRTDWNLFLAGVNVAALPIIIFYFIAQKYIISGLTFGSVKG